MTKPARRVIYRSTNARLARFALGIVFAAVTAWLVLPVLAIDRGPPPPFAITLGTNALDLGPRDANLPGTALSVLNVTARAQGCSNPVTLEGTLWRSTDTWYAEKRGRFARPPTQAIITLAGVPVSSFAAGLDSFYTHAVEGVRHVSGIARVTSLNGKSVVVHDHMLRLIHSDGTTSAVLNAPQWPQAATPLWFAISADLMRPAGFQSCYLDLPQLFPYQSSTEGETSASARSQIQLIRIGEHMHSPRALKSPTGLADEPEGLGAGAVTVSVDGKRVADGSIGAGATTTTSGGLRYRCHRFVRQKVLPGLDSRISPEFNQQANPDCSGTPLFEAADVTSDTTRRLFAAGIIGALAATLIVEALFLGETESAAQEGKTRKRSRWRQTD
ncbi:MAG TPA: hypothetical protein VK730_11030 [Solirubrobacteraceae bacterium]|jgi:hypothetical protein|nr:hypothetical protein [Solirubrobacteraceae bacterium]